MSEGYVNGHAIKTGTWTEEEDLLLLAWQQSYGNKWSKVAEHIPGRTGQQCAQRWRHKVNPNIKKDKWSEQEDAQLRRLVERYGNKWAEIARHMDGRTDQQCMGRWTRHLDPKISRDAWRAEEDALLLEHYNKYGSQWSRISKLLPGRTSQQCRQRFCQLHPELQREVDRAEGAGAGRSAGTSRGSGGGDEGGGVEAPARPARAAKKEGGSKRKTYASRDQDWYEEEDGAPEEEDEDWALEQKAFESYRTGAQRRADKARQREAAAKAQAQAGRRDEGAGEGDAARTLATMPIKKRGRSHSVAQPASASPMAGITAPGAVLLPPGVASLKGDDGSELDPLASIMRMESAPPNLLHVAAPPDFLRGLFSPEAPKPAHRDSKGLLADGGQRTPLVHGAGSGAMEGALMPPPGILLNHPPGSVPPPSAPWKLTPTAHVFSPGFVMNTGYELPTPITVLRRLQGAAGAGRDGKEGSHLDLPLYALEPLMNSPGALVALQGMDTPGVLMNRPSRMPTEAAPSALKPSALARQDSALQAGPGPSPLLAVPLALSKEGTVALDAPLETLQQKRESEDALEPRSVGSPSASGRPLRGQGEGSRAGAGPSVMPPPPSALLPGTQETLVSLGAGLGASRDPSTAQMLPSTAPHDRPSEPATQPSALLTRASDQTFLSPTPRHRVPGARLPHEDPWTPSGALQPSSVRPMPVSRLANQPVPAAGQAAQTTLCQAGLVPQGKENRQVPLAEKRHAVYALLDEVDV